MNEILILNSDLTPVTVLDKFKSLIWTERYCGFGDFEIYTSMDPTIYDLLERDTFIREKTSDNLMIVEKRQIITDSEFGDQLLIKGRSLESLLYRRILWDQTILNGSMQAQIQSIMNANLISPSNSNRQITEFEMGLSSDPDILALTIERQSRGDYLYDVITEACKPLGLGYRVRFTSSKKFRLELYFGVDRSFSQLTNPNVIFSRKYDNLFNSNYEYDKTEYKTVTLILGAGEEPDRKETSTTLLDYEPTGLDRRETFTDAKSLSLKDDAGVTIPEVDYINQLKQKGKEELANATIIDNFESEVDPNASFVYGMDYFLGDIVQIEDDYGTQVRARITEIVKSSSDTGDTVIPTFENLEAE